VPLNIIVVLFLLLVGSVARETLIIGCALLCSFAAICQRGLAAILTAEAVAKQEVETKAGNTESLAAQLGADTKAKVPPTDVADVV
jgi:hypothetical protein